MPFAEFAPHTASTGFDFSRNASFAPVETAFVALLGDLSPNTTGGVVVHAGHEVVMVSPSGTVSRFLTSPTMSALGQLVFRPTNATFDRTGQALYVTHFGQIDAVAGGIAPKPGTVALIRIRAVR